MVKKNRTTLITGILPVLFLILAGGILMIGLGTSPANAMMGGPGMGYGGMGSGGMGQGYPGYAPGPRGNGWSNTPGYNDRRPGPYYDEESVGLHSELDRKQQELNNVLSAEETDFERAKALQKEINDLKARLSSRAPRPSESRNSWQPGWGRDSMPMDW